EHGRERRQADEIITDVRQNEPLDRSLRPKGVTAVREIVERDAGGMGQELRDIDVDANGEQQRDQAVAERGVQDSGLVVADELRCRADDAHAAGPHSPPGKLTRSRSMTSGVPRVRSEISRTCTPNRPRKRNSSPNWSSSK